MIVVDSSALVAILRREPEADRFLQVIAAADRCFLSAVSLLKTSMVLAGRTGDGTAWAGLDALIARAGIEVVPHDAEQARLAREAFLNLGRASDLYDVLSKEIFYSKIRCLFTFRCGSMLTPKECAKHIAKAGDFRAGFMPTVSH